jgi:dsRNA-specific ribonuclease
MKNREFTNKTLFQRIKPTVPKQVEEVVKPPIIKFDKTIPAKKELFVVTPDFRNFILDILRYRCLLKESTVTKYFDNPETLSLFQQAFVHKSAGRSNYELFEHRGDVVLNLAVVEYIKDKFPDITSVDWYTLARIAMDNGFGKYIKWGPKMDTIIERYKDNLDDADDYMGMFEDTVESLLGVINEICNDNFIRGVGYGACYSLIKSYLDNIEIKTSYQDVWDSISRLKELFDQQGWNNTFDCNLQKNLLVYEIGKQDAIINHHLYGQPLVKSDIDRFVAFGYVCINGGERKLLSIKTAGKKKDAKKLAAEETLKKLNSMGISIDLNKISNKLLFQ